MAERPRDACVEPAILRRWVTLRLNFRLKGYVSRQYLWTISWGNGYATTLPLEVFTQRNFIADILFDWNWILFKNNKKPQFEPTFGELQCNVRTTSIARWKARCRLYIRHDWTFFHVLRLRSYGTVICRSRRFFEGWVTLNANFRRKGSSPTDHCWCQKTKMFALSCGIKISTVHCLILSQSTRVTDGQTDG